MINIFRMALDANETREVALTGEYFEVRSQVYPLVKIELTDKSGGIVSVIDTPLESDYVRPGRYERMTITNGATPQIVSFWHGSGDAGSRRFSGNVTGTVALDAPTLAALESVDLNDATVNKVMLRNTGSYATNAAGAAGGVQTMVAAGANTNGLWVTEAQLFGYNTGAAHSIALIAKATAPATSADGEVLLQAGANAGTPFAARLEKQVYVAAGLGLHYFNFAADSGHAGLMRAARWKLL